MTKQCLNTLILICLYASDVHFEGSLERPMAMCWCFQMNPFLKIRMISTADTSYQHFCGVHTLIWKHKIPLFCFS